MGLPSPMVRAKLKPVLDACKDVIEANISLGGEAIPVGVDGAPDCDRPYIIVGAVSSPRYTGPINNTEADSNDRIQFTASSPSSDQANWLRDKVREVLTVANLDAAFVANSANRRTLMLILDIPRGTQRDDRGLPEPIFNSIDQYMIETTPTA